MENSLSVEQSEHTNLSTKLPFYMGADHSTPTQYNSNQRSQITITNIRISFYTIILYNHFIEMLVMFQDLQNMTQRHKMSKCIWKKMVPIDLLVTRFPQTLNL